MDCRAAGVRLSSSRPDNVRATKDAAMIVAADESERVLRLPHPMASVEGGAATTEHRLSMQFGEVKLLVKATQPMVNVLQGVSILMSCRIVRSLWRAIGTGHRGEEHCCPGECRNAPSARPYRHTL